MKQRTITGAFVMAAVYAVICFSHIPAVILSAAAILSACSAYEIHHAANTTDHEVFFTLSILAAVGIIFWQIPHYDRLIGIVFPLSAAVFIRLMVRQKECRLSHPAKASGIALLTAVLFKAMPELSGMECGVYYLLAAATVCFVTDVAAYLVGKNFGKHKLLPKVSPNKTVEGSAAGTACSVLVLFLGGMLIQYLGITEVNHPLLMVYALLDSAAGQFGDLAMSSVKRVCGVKDFGEVFPGHGGILDRFDSHLFSAAFTFIFCTITGGFLG